MPRLLLLFALLLTVPALLGGGPGDPRFSDRIQAELDATIQARMRQMDLPSVVVGLWVPGVGEFVRAYGDADPATGRARTLADHQRIGSITKMFMGEIILQLADEGRLSVDDPISTYLSTDGRPGTVRVSQPIPGWDRITLRNLASMTSGIASYTFNEAFLDELFGNPQRQWDPRDLMEIGIRDTVAGCPSAPPACFAPGTRFFYSNTNTVILGLIAEELTGKSFETLLRERITGPLKMTTTGVSTAQLPSPFARGFTYQGSETTPVRQDATDWNPSWGFTAGNMQSTLEDMRIWARHAGRGDGLSQAAREARFLRLDVPGHDPATRAYAFAIGYTTGWWGHTGELPGYMITVQYRPDLDATLVVMTGIDSVPGFSPPSSTIAEDIIAIAAREAPLGQLDPVLYPATPARN